jgi:SP family facilitated glucose transporter-like MFS transporter 3
MQRSEKSKLLGGRNDPLSGDESKDKFSKFLTDNSDYARSVRSHTMAKLGGSSSMGNFRMNLGDDLSKALPRSYSATMDGQLPILSPSEMARQEMYTQVPFVAMYGLQKKEREVANTFANYAADLDVAQMRGLSDEDKSMRHASSSMLILDEMEDAKVVTAPLIFTVIVVSASMFSVGYNTSVMNAPEKLVFPGHSITSWALAVAAFAIGGPFGSASGGKLADKRGRRGAMLVGIWIFLLGGLLQSVAQDMLTIILARFIIGFASGYTTVLVPIYLGEVAPPSLRGTLGTLTQFAMVIGILFADLVAFPLATPSGWRFMFSITGIIAIGQLLLSPFLLESPRWLLNRDPQSLRARYIIKKLRGLRNEHEVEREVGNFIIGESAQHHDENQKGDVLKELMSHNRRRKLLISCLILQMAQQLSGINAVFFYSTAILEGVIDNPLVGTTVIGAVNVIATYVALLVMDSTGRRALLLWSSGGMFISCLVIVLALLGMLSNMFALLAVNTYVFCFEIGLGPIPWLIVAEMFDGKYVTVAMSLCSQLNWGCNFIVGMVFPYMNAYLGPYSFFPFAIILALTFLFTLFILPETQGKTPDELVAELVTRSSQSMVYEINTEEAGAINDEWKKAMEQLMEEEQHEMDTGNYDYGFKPITN